MTRMAPVADAHPIHRACLLTQAIPGGPKRAMPNSDPHRGRTFRATCPEGSVEWFARAPHLVGTPDLVAKVEAALASRGSILLTPTIRSVSAVTTSADGVLAALLSLGLDFTFSGNVPRIPTVPGGAVV